MGRSKVIYELSKRVMFCAAHSIKGAGKCENKHGHNWEANITVRSNALDERGFIADVAAIKQAAFQYDHDDLDKYFEQPTTELVAQKIAEDTMAIVRANLGAVEGLEVDVLVHLTETENNTATARSSYADRSTAAY